MKISAVKIQAGCVLLALLCSAAPAQDREAQLAEVVRLDAQAQLLYQSGRYSEAIPLQERVIAILEKTFDPEHRAVALSLGNLASSYQAAGDYVRAELSCQRALTIFQTKFGPESPEIAKLYGTLAVVYFAKGDRARAELTLGRALEMYGKIPDRNESEVAKLYSDLGVMYLEIADYSQAGAYFGLALPILEKTLGREHQVIAIVLNNLALVARAEGRLAHSESYLQRALAIHGMHNPEHPDITGPLINLALLYYDKGEYDRAEPLYRRALNLLEKTLGPEHPEIGKVLHNLAILYREKKDYARAESSYQRALAIGEKKFGPDHPDVAQSLYDLAYLYYAEDDYERALQFLTRGNEVQERSLTSILKMGSEWQKQLYLNTLESTLHVAVSLNVSAMPQDERAARLALTTILQRKGRVLDTVAGQRTFLRLLGTPEDQDLLQKLASLHAELTTLQAQNQISPVERKIRVAVLSMAVERIEGELSRRSAEVGRQAPPISLKAVQQALPSDAALVEIFQYRPFKAKTLNSVDQWDPPRYVAYVIRSNESTPQWVELGNATLIDAAVTRLRAALKDPRRTDSQTVGRAMDERIMRPIRKLLGPTRRLFLSPDGTLNLIPFAALVDENGKYLVENYSLTYLTSGLDLLRLNVPTETNGATVVIANPLFDLTIVSRPGSSRDQAKQSPGKADAQSSMDFLKTSYSPLPGTADEAEALKKLWPGARVLTQHSATEAALKQVNRPLVLHIATHGFFLPDESPTSSTERRPERTIDSFLFLPLPKRWGNPLLRSGLILAGVNQQSSGPGEDGVLTAMEVAGLDLRGTKLVVLSACETAVGDVKTGEGVYGLRRALTLAGSEAQVMSLWKVSDAGTRDLMTAYYTRLQKGEGRAEALRQVQLMMLHRQLKATASGGKRGTTDASEKIVTKDYRHPYYWAAFIQSGDWRSLDRK